MPTALPTLYKKSGKKVQQWTIIVGQEADGTAYTSVEHGQVDGKMQSTRVNYKEGKNAGRANATNALQQAESEARSKHTKQKDKGYVENPDGIATAEAPLPMLAHNFKDYSHQVTYPCMAQPKLDGMRCISIKKDGQVTLWSRLGKPINTMPHIQEVLNVLMEDGEVWDGELYAHGISFQTQISWLKKFDRDNHIKVKYHVYDMVDTDKNFDERMDIITNRIIAKQKEGKGHIINVPTAPVQNESHVIKAHAYFVSQGYEGAMLRHGNCKYTPNKRSRQLLKVKEFIDQEFEITGAKENSGKMEGTCTFILKTIDGGVFECTPKGSDSQRRQYFEDFKQGKLTGKMMTVRFFEWTDGKPGEPPVPRFPVGIGIRDYE